jgi:hypothetical protein
VNFLIHVKDLEMAASRLLIPIALTVLAVPILAQKAQSLCGLVTSSEAAGILGASVDQQDAGRTCVYRLKGPKATLVLEVRTKPVANAAATKANVTNAGATLQNEPNLGTGAYSAALKNSARVYMFKGNQMLILEATDTSQAKLADGTMDKVRAEAKKALDRYQVPTGSK